MGRELTNYERAVLSLVYKELAVGEKDLSCIHFKRGMYGQFGVQEQVNGEEQKYQIFFDTTFEEDGKLSVNFMKNEINHDNLVIDVKSDSFVVKSPAEISMSLFPWREFAHEPNHILNSTFDVIGQSIVRVGREVVDTRLDDINGIDFKLSGDERLSYFTFKVVENRFVLVAHISDIVAEPPVKDIIESALTDEIYDFIDEVQYVNESKTW